MVMKRQKKSILDIESIVLLFDKVLKLESKFVRTFLCLRVYSFKATSCDCIYSKCTLAIGSNFTFICPRVALIFLDEYGEKLMCAFDIITVRRKMICSAV